MWNSCSTVRSQRLGTFCVRRSAYRDYYTDVNLAVLVPKEGIASPLLLTNFYGNAVGDGETDVLSCVRPKGHSRTKPVVAATPDSGATWTALE